MSPAWIGPAWIGPAWVWLVCAAVVGIIIGAVGCRWWYSRRQDAAGKVNQDYFKGLNFLLNEEPDKAIEVFIKALEVDSETVELHLALGGLFRRKGQVDRATRIHQNLIARPSLTESQRLQAIHELAQDYQRAGLLDRAEDLFMELRESVAYREIALSGLAQIYQQEKEWQQAIEAIQAQKRSVRDEQKTTLAHYWCELAEVAMQAQEYDTARKYLRNALSEDRQSARAVMLRGDLHFELAEFSKAVSLWQSLVSTQDELVALRIDKIIQCFQQLGNESGLRAFLGELKVVPRDKALFERWYRALVACLGAENAWRHLISTLKTEGLSAPASEFLHAHAFGELRDAQWAVNAETTKSECLGLLEDLLVRAKHRRIEYTCNRCGFDTKSHYWLCQNCGTWDSFKV